MDDLQLISPTVKYKESFFSALKSFDEEGISGFWNHPHPPKSIEEYIKRTQAYSQGHQLPEGAVPATTYWLVDKGQFVGHANLRHQLNENLRRRSGNIGLYIRKSHRHQGYGTKMLSLVLQKARVNFDNELIRRYWIYL